jgi:hypothetical protein
MFGNIWVQVIFGEGDVLELAPPIVSKMASHSCQFAWTYVNAGFWTFTDTNAVGQYQ